MCLSVQSVFKPIHIQHVHVCILHHSFIMTLEMSLKSVPIGTHSYEIFCCMSEVMTVYII